MKTLKVIIGLEIHVYLKTKEKLFCQCKASREKGIKPNSMICPICTGQPGAKPMLPNKTAVEKCVQVGLISGCKINNSLSWKRKHYDWPDLPKGYQNTLSGKVALPVGEKGKFLGIRIKSVHLEEDPAAWDPKTGRVDYNRSGFPLIEIVTEPDFSTAEEVVAWLKKLVLHLKYLKAVDVEAGLKADVNVSLPGKTERVEIKNINSIDNISSAIDYEISRQLKEGSVKETRRFDETSGKTLRMRGKEAEDDYRFINEPDLKCIYIDDEFISVLRRGLPEMPEEKLTKLIKKYNIEKKDAEVLAKNLDVVEFYERVAKKIDGKFVLHWIASGLLGMLNYNKTNLENVSIETEHFVELLQAVKSGKITELQGKKLLQEFYPNSFSLKNKGFQEKISDENKLEKVCKDVMNKEKNVVERYKSGEKNLLNFLVGEVMKKTEKRADFRIVREIFERLLA